MQSSPAFPKSRWVHGQRLIARCATAMNDGRSAADDCEKNSGFDLAAILMASGMLAPLLGKGVLHPDESRQLIDHAITTLEQSPLTTR